MANFITVQQLYDQPKPERLHLVEMLLPAGGLTFLVGKPKVGKSLLARLLIFACATGTPFLGFLSVLCAVLYLAIEEWAPEVSRHFQDMGLPADAPVHILVGSLEEAWLTKIRAKLTACPEIKLLVIDPILLAVRVKDANEYAPMMKALEGVREVARELGVAIVCVHHSKKTMSADVGDHALGSTAIRGSVDATWQIIKKEDGKRTFQTEMRYGKDLPPTILIFDEDSRTSRLGGEEAYLGRRQEAINRDRVADTILDYVGNHPLQTRTQILDNVPFKSEVKSGVFTQLERDGLLIASGAGVKGDPHLYTVNLPTEAIDA
jgi:hypothetical protein